MATHYNFTGSFTLWVQDDVNDFLICTQSKASLFTTSPPTIAPLSPFTVVISRLSSISFPDDFRVSGQY